MKTNFEKVKKILKMLDEITDNGDYRNFEVAYLFKEMEDFTGKSIDNITEQDVKDMNNLIDFRDDIIDEGLKYDIADKFGEEE